MNSTTSCETCATGYYLNGSTCILNLANCKTMKNDTACSICNDGYYSTGDTCTLC